MLNGFFCIANASSCMRVLICIHLYVHEYLNIWIWHFSFMMNGFVFMANTSFFMYVCVLVCVYIYMYIDFGIHKYTCAHIHACCTVCFSIANTSSCVHLCVCVCIYIYAYICIHTYTCARIHVCMNGFFFFANTSSSSSLSGTHMYVWLQQTCIYFKHKCIHTCISSQNTYWYACVYMHVYRKLRKYRWSPIEEACVYKKIHTHIHIDKQTHAHTYILDIRTHVHTYIRAYMLWYVYVYIDIHTHI